MLGKQHVERWVRLKTDGLGEEEFLQPACGGERKGTEEGGGRVKGWGCSLAPATPAQNQRLLLDSMPACACTHMHTCVHVRACLSAVARTGVNKSTGWFDKSRGDVTGKREGNSLLVLAGCSYLRLTRPARRQALCR